MPRLFTPISIQEERGILLKAKSIYIKLLDQSDYTWKDTKITDFIGGDNCANVTESKIIQVNTNEVYIIGGDSSYPSLVAGYYNVPTSCLHVNLKTGELTVKSSMNRSRKCHGAC